MEPVNPQIVLDPDSISSADRGGAISGVGTGGGKTEVDSTHYLKDNGIGGALPDTKEGLDTAVKSKHYQNEKAMEGSLTLVCGFPSLNAGDKIAVTGVGPVFSGEWIIKTHTLKVSQDGCHSTLDLTRNAVGDKGGGAGDSSGGFDTEQKKTDSRSLGYDNFIGE